MVGDGLWDGPTVERSAHSVRTGELDLGDQADNGHFGGFGGDSDDPPAGYKEIHFSDGAVQWAAQKDLTDPSTFDSDGDGLSDGQELGGWDVNVIWEKTKERDSAQSRRVRSDPTIKDTDHDGLDDFNEFQNLGDPLVRDTDGDRILDERVDERGNVTGARVVERHVLIGPVLEHQLHDGPRGTIVPGIGHWVPDVEDDASGAVLVFGWQALDHRPRHVDPAGQRIARSTIALAFGGLRGGMPSLGDVNLDRVAERFDRRRFRRPKKNCNRRKGQPPHP